MTLSKATVTGQISVDFSVDNTEGCSTVQSDFRDLSTSTQGNIDSWLWSIGEITSTVQNPGRVFTNPGTFDVCLTVSDDAGNESTLCKEGLISVYAQPKADFTYDVIAGCSPLGVNFTDLSTSENGGISSWEWVLGGSVGTLFTDELGDPIFTVYEDDGFQSITLNITDEKGCKSSITRQDIIQVEKEPEIIVGTADPIGCAFPLDVDFVNFGQENNVEYFWDFGNGDTFVGYDPGVVTYLSQGNYDVSVTSKFEGSTCSNELVLKDYISTGGSILFDFSPKLGCKGLEVQFEDQSPVDAESWVWDFGDGTTSSERDPVHKYNFPGVYSVSLFRDSGECNGSKTSDFQVEVLDNPKIMASIDNSAGCILPAEVSYEVIQEPGVNYTWVIADDQGTLSQTSGLNGSYTFDSYGTYRITIIGSNVAGCLSSLVLDTVQVEPLKAEIVGVSEGCVPFDANLSILTNSASPIVNVDWEIEGPWNVNESNDEVSFLVDQQGSFNAKAIVTNNLGCVDTVEVIDLISGGASPVVDFEVSGNNICPRELVNFTDLSTGDIDSWTWIIGDSLVFETQDLSTEINIPGKYSVTLEVESNGCTIVKTLEDYITVNDPGVGFQLEYNCEDPYTVSAINGSVNSDANIWRYAIVEDTFEINGGDSISITLPDRGDYYISLEAFNNSSGCSNIAFDDIMIRVPEADFTIDRNSGCAPLEILFTDESTDAQEFEYFTSKGAFIAATDPNSTLGLKFGGTYSDIGLIVKDIHGCSDTTYAETIQVNGIDAKFNAPAPVCFSDTLKIENQSFSTFADIVKSTWTLGNGLAISQEEDAQFVAPEIGKFDLKIVVEDSWGCIDSTFLGLGAFFRAPNFELSTDTLACTTAPLRFRNTLHSAGYMYEWDFGDGNISNEINPLHTYATEGEYEIQVSIVDDDQCASSMDLSKSIKVYDPIASFTIDTSFAACPPLTPNFTNLSLNSVAYKWNFGDSTAIGTSFEPSHLYTFAGFFDVSLIAYRSEACQDTIVFDDLVQLDGPRGNISFQVDSSCVPVGVNFEATLDEDYTMTWDFGDGVLELVDDTTNFNMVTHHYQNAGTFIPKIILTNDANCTIVREGEAIETNDLQANFALGDSVFCDGVPAEVQLIDLSFATSPILKREWLISGSVDTTIRGLNPGFSVQDTGFSNIDLIISSEFCIDTISKNDFLRIGERPLLDLQVDTFLCLGQSITLAVDSLLSGIDYQWLDGNTEIGEKTTVVSPTKSQFYILEGSNKYSCNARDSIFVSVINDETRFAGPDKTICSGNETEVSIDFSDEVYWPTLLNCFECETVILAPDSSELFPVIATNEFGCLVRDSIFVEVLFDSDIDAGEDQRICVTETPILLAYVPGDVRWSPAELLSNPNEQLTSAEITENTLFTLTSVKGDCTLTDSVLIEVVEQAELSVMGDSICYGDTATLFAGGIVDNVEWQADPTLTSLMTSTTMSTTTEDRSYLVFGDLDGCVSDTARVDVIVYPEIQIDVPLELRYLEGQVTVDLSIENPGGKFGFLWQPANLVNCLDCSEVSVAVDGDTVTLKVDIVNFETTCVLEREIHIRPYNSCEDAAESIFVPNIFSPNGDGFNDEVNVKAPVFGDIENLSIFDRWGQKIFSSNSINISWNGIFNSVPALEGVYAYRLSAICPIDGRIIYKSGDITLIR